MGLTLSFFFVSRNLNQLEHNDKLKVFTCGLKLKMPTMDSWQVLWVFFNHNDWILGTTPKQKTQRIQVYGFIDFGHASLKNEVDKIAYLVLKTGKGFKWDDETPTKTLEQYPFPSLNLDALLFKIKLRYPTPPIPGDRNTKI